MLKQACPLLSACTRFPHAMRALIMIHFQGKIVAICHCHIRIVRVYSANHSVSIEDAKRVEDPILFVRPCKCIEDARSLVPASKAASASKRNFSTGRTMVEESPPDVSNPTPNPLPFPKGEGSYHYHACRVSACPPSSLTRVGSPLSSASIEVFSVYEFGRITNPAEWR